jgi:peptide/nickel transport system substrate-binding protein
MNPIFRIDPPFPDIHATAMRNSLPFLPVVLAATALFFTACGPRKTGSEMFPRSETLFLGITWGEPNTFNPLASSASWPAAQNMTALYQPLFFFNQESGNLEPQLATSYRQFPDRIEVDLHPAATWNDGRPVTARDVAFTYSRLYRISPGFPTWQYLSEVKILDPAAEHPMKLAFILKPDNLNPLMVRQWLTLDFILPAHIWGPALESVGGNFQELAKLKFDRNPVASGPYRLLSYSAEKIVLERDEKYWGNSAYFEGRLPTPRFLVAPIYKSNDHYSMALQQARIDASNTFIPRIWLKKRKGINTWFDQAPYFPPGCIPTAYINALRPPLDNIHLRRAMAYAINYKDIQELAVSGYSLPLEPGFILPFGPESRYFSKEDAQQFGTRYDPAKAREELAAGGFSPVFKEGALVEWRDASGKKLPTLFIQSPTGWSDWESIVRIMVRGMRQAGIDVREQFVDSTVYSRAAPLGDFDLILTTPSNIPSPAEPWSRFKSILDTKDWAPPGERMFSNMGRFNRPGSPGYVKRLDELLARIPVVTDEAELGPLYRELNRLCMQLQPALPLVYRPKSFYEFNHRHWTGFPTSANPFLPPNIPTEGAGIRVLWHVQPVPPR